MQEMRIWYLDWEHTLEEGMTTHSGILAWKISWTEESGGLQSKVLQKGRHDWVTEYAGTHDNKNNDTLLGSAHFLASTWLVLIWECSLHYLISSLPPRTVGWWPSSIHRWDPEAPRLVTRQSHHVWCYKQIWAVGSGPFCNSAVMFSSWGDLRIII